MSSAEKNLILEEFFDLDIDETFYSKDLIITTSNDLEKGDVDLLKIIEIMESGLNNKCSTNRIQAMSFIFNVLSKLSKSHLSQSEIHNMCCFLNNRLSSDHHVCKIILDLFLLLIDQENMLDDDVCDILQSMFKEITCQYLIMSERKTFYLIINKCLQKKLKAICKINTKFILGFISAFEGETDPRNLMLVFSFYPSIALNVPLDKYAEDFFEVVAAYFPINFTPPSDVSDPISNEELVGALRLCMSASEDLLPYCIPYLIEKITSEPKSFDIEALLILKNCCKKYNTSGIAPHLWSLLFMFYNMITESIHNEIIHESLECIKLISSLYTAKDMSNEEMGNACETISSLIAECMPNIISPGHRLAIPSYKILASAGYGAKIFSEMICLKTIPPLFDAMKNASEYSVRKTYLLIITELIKNGSTYKLIFEEKFYEIQKEYFIIYSTILKSKNDELFETSLIYFSENITSFRKDQITSYILNLLLHPQLNEVKCLTESCLSSCCDVHPDIIANDIVEYMVNYLETNENLMEISPYLVLFPSICRHNHVLNKILPKIYSWLDKSIQTKSKSSHTLLEVALKCCQIAYDCKVLGIGSVSRNWSDVQHMVEMALYFINWQTIELQNKLELLSSIIHYFVSWSDRSIIENLIMFLIGKKELQLKTNLLSENYNAPPDLTDSKNVQEGYIIFPIFGIIRNASCLNAMESEHMNYLRMALYNLSCFSTNVKCRGLASRTVSILFNLFDTGYNLIPALDIMNNFIATNLESNEKLVQESVITMKFWATKGLIMRNYDDAFEYACMLDSYLLSKEYGLFASKQYQILLQDFDDLFCKSIGANVRILYKQRYFEGRIGSLVKQFYETSGYQRYNTQMAIMNLLPCLPISIIYSYLPKILPILVQCISSDNASVIKVGVSCLISLVPKSPEVFVEHFTKIILSLVKNSHSDDLTCRLKCLECIVILSSLPSIKIIPYKDEVLLGLQRTLGDKKRVVRKLSALAVMSWDAIGV